MALRLEERMKIMDLKQKGYAIRKISRELGINRITVKRYLANPQKEKYHRLMPYPSKLSSYKEYILKRLKEYPDIAATKLYREIKTKGYNGGERIVTYFVSKNRPVNEKRVFLRYETGPGEEAQVDWGEFWHNRLLWEKVQASLFQFCIGLFKKAVHRVYD